MQDPIQEIKHFSINHLDEDIYADTASMRRRIINPRFLRELEVKYTREHRTNTTIIGLLSITGIVLAFMLIPLTSSAFALTNWLVALIALLFVIIAHMAISQRNRNVAKNLFIVRLVQKVQEDYQQ